MDEKAFDGLIKQIGKRLTHFRQQLHLLPNQAADAAGVSCDWLRRLEAGANPPTVRSLAKMADVLGVRIVDLLAEEAGAKKCSQFCAQVPHKGVLGALVRGVKQHGLGAVRRACYALGALSGWEYRPAAAAVQKLTPAKCNKLIAANVAARRRQLGLSQQRLCEMIGRPSNYLSKVESAAVTMSAPTLAQIAEALDTSVDALVWCEPDVEAEEARTDKLFDALVAGLVDEYPDDEFIRAVVITVLGSILRSHVRS